MKQFYLVWLYALSLTAFVVSSLLTVIDEKRLLRDTASQLAALSTSIEDSVLLNYREGRINRISKLVDRLRADQQLVGLSICDKKNGIAIGFPKGSDIEQVCTSQKAI